jgi:hypothetical protein
MRPHRLSYVFSPIAIAILVHTPVIDVAAQELSQCYVASIPCGTPANFERLLHQCLQDPDLCEQPGDRRASVPASGEARPSFPVSTTSVRVNAKSSTRAVTLTQPHTESLARPRQPRENDANSAGVGPGEEPEAGNPEVDQLVRDLPFDSVTRNLSNAMPADPNAVELRLGLRRTQAVGTDMRGRTPSPDEIVQALVPKGKSVQ